MSTKLKYILIGNILKKKEIAEFPKSNEQVNIVLSSMLKRLSRFSINYVKRITTNSRNVSRLFLSQEISTSLPHRKVIFLSVNFLIMKAFVDTNYSERYVYEFFENIQKEEIIDNVDEDGEINSTGKSKLKTLFDKYEDVKNMNSIIAANLEIDGVRTQMKNNIKGMMNNLTSLNVKLIFITGSRQ